MLVSKRGMRLDRCSIQGNPRICNLRSVKKYCPRHKTICLFCFDVVFRQQPAQSLPAQRKAAARKGSGLFSLRYRSGGTASWKLSQVYSAASTWPQVYPAASHSAQVR